MKELLKSNIYDCDEEIIIVGSCLKAMQPLCFEELEKKGLPIFEVCLEQTHINMVITKVLGMIRAKKIRHIIFASVDRSPHCIQLHYIQDEITKIGINIKFTNLVCCDNKIYEISKETISLSKNLKKLNDFTKNNNILQ